MSLAETACAPRRLAPTVAVCLLAACLPALAARPSESSVIDIPRVERPPALEDFLAMPDNGAELPLPLARVEGFIQQEPSDGKPATQRTVVYLGYDDRHLYVIFLCFDSQPELIRARMAPRETIFGDDTVQVQLDTFHDQRRAYTFMTNPFGIQWDAVYTEGGEARPGGVSRSAGGAREGPRGFDTSFDTLWYSRGQRTPQGYVVWMALPFKSLRFPDRAEQTWGILLHRTIPRLNERIFWPHYSSRIEGRLNQAATLRGLRHISPGRNIQLIPFGVFRSFRELDTRDPNRPAFTRDPAQADLGLDAKLVFKDSLVLDAALNPDFSQVESDEPQVTVNQRFEVFFPEKRPFFLENASFFETPINLVFSRRIADPQFGVRLTGKTGPYALGALLVDDESPGKLVPPGHPLAGQRAFYGIVRVNRDLFSQSTLGLIYTHRDFLDTSNRVGGLDARLKLNSNWVARAQAVTSSTRCLPPDVRAQLATAVDLCFGTDPVRLAGPAYDLKLTRSGRQLNYTAEYNDRSRGFRTAPGFLERPDIRRLFHTLRYRFRPEGRYLIAYGPQFFYQRVWDHSEQRLDWTYDNNFFFEFVRQSWFGGGYNNTRERLRPIDFPVLAEPRDFNRKHIGIGAGTSWFRPLTFEGLYLWGQRINFAPSPAAAPYLADWANGTFSAILRPSTALRIDNTYLLTRLLDRATGDAIFNNHILRSKWNYQFTPRLSLRLILQYTSVLANPRLTELDTTKNFNADFLLTYLVHPGTVLFIGYNGNAQNLELLPTATGATLLYPRRRFTHDARQFFVKFSYLFRF